MTPTKRIAIITGANRGIGLATAYLLAKHGCTSIIACRNPKLGKRAAYLLSRLKLNVEDCHVDVTDPNACKRSVADVINRHGRIDILINNAGVFEDTGSALKLNENAIRRSFETNTLGSINMIQAVAPMMMARNFGRIVNVSSGMAALTHAEAGSLAYRLSKVALNMSTVVFSKELKEYGVLVNSVCPGWVRTRITSGAKNKPIDAAYGVALAAFLDDNSFSGCFLRDGKIIEW